MMYESTFQEELDNMPNEFLLRFKKGAWSKIYIRDLLLTCLLIFGGGHDDDVIRNMTVEEWNHRRLEETPQKKQETIS